MNLGTVQSSSSSATWAVGLVRDPVIQYATANGIEQRSPWWRSQFDSVQSMVFNFTERLDNLSNTLERLPFSSKIIRML